MAAGALHPPTPAVSSILSAARLTLPHPPARARALRSRPIPSRPAACARPAPRHPGSAACPGPATTGSAARRPYRAGASPRHPGRSVDCRRRAPWPARVVSAPPFAPVDESKQIEQIERRPRPHPKTAKRRRRVHQDRRRQSPQQRCRLGRRQHQNLAVRFRMAARPWPATTDGASGGAIEGLTRML